jgi:hypothetical protein
MARPVRKVIHSPVSVRFGKGDRTMILMLRARAHANKRSISDQMKYFAYLGMIGKDNPDLPMSFIEGILEGLGESRAGMAAPYQWGRIVEQEG